MCFGGDSGGGNTSTVVQSNTLPPVVDQGYQQLLAMGTAGANIPYTAYQAPRIAGFSDMQNQGFAQTGTAATGYQPYLDQSQQYTQQGAQPIAPTLGSFDQSAFQQYGNPYTQDVINSSNQEIQRQGTIGNQTIAGNAAQAGAFGGDRATVAQTENNRNTLNTIARNTDTLNQQNFQQAQGQFNTEQNRGLAARESDQSAAARAAGAEAALGGQAQQQGLTGASALLSAGAQQQQQNQSGLNLAYNDFKQQQLWPQEQATYLNSIIHGLGAPTSSTTTSPGPSIAGQVAGLGAAGIGGLGASGAFGSSGWLTGGAGAASNSTIASQAASDVGTYNFFAPGGIVGYADGGYASPAIDPESYYGPDDPRTDNSNAGRDVYSSPAGPEQTQASILSDMSDRQLIAARDDPQFSPSLVDEQLTARNLRSGFGKAVSGIGSYIGDALTNTAQRVSAANQVAPPSDQDVEATRNVGPTIGKAASDVADWFTEPVIPPGESERGSGVPPAPVTKDTDVGAPPAPPSIGIKAANAAEPSGDTSSPTLVPGGGTLLPDGNQRPVGSPGGKAAPPAPPQAGIGPPANMDRNGIAPPVAAPAIASPAPPIPPAPPTGAPVPNGPPLGIDHNGIAGQQAAPAASGHPGWVNGAPPIATPTAAASPNAFNGINPWLALMKGGAAMAASKSPFALTAAGEGALAGTTDIEHQQQIAAAAGLKQAELARKTAHDQATAQYQLARITSRDELTKQQAQWHADEVAARREAATERSEDRRASLLQHADSLAMNQQMAQARLDEVSRANDQKAANAADARTKNADTAERLYLKSVGVPEGMTPEPAQRAAAENHIIDMYPDSPQAQTYKAARNAPQPQPVDHTQAIPRQVYMTKQGPQRWTGSGWAAP